MGGESTRDSGYGENQVCFAQCQGDDHENTKSVKLHVMFVMCHVLSLESLKLDMCDSQVCSTACGWYLYARSLRKSSLVVARCCHLQGH